VTTTALLAVVGAASLLDLARENQGSYFSSLACKRRFMSNAHNIDIKEQQNLRVSSVPFSIRMAANVGNHWF